MKIGSLESGNVTIKVLTTNTTSLTVLTEEKFKGKVIQPLTKANRVVGEHGLSMSIEVEEGDKKNLYLIDTGSLTQSIFGNAKQLGVDLTEVEKLILTHGHFDHFGGLLGLMPQLKEGTEFIVNPSCFMQNVIIAPKQGVKLTSEDLSRGLRKLQKEGKVQLARKLPSLDKNKIHALAEQYKINLNETVEPIKMHDGIVTSGQIELFDPEETTKGIYLQKDKNNLEKHTFRDETAVYMNINDKGLVVLTGCGHCGIKNIIQHGQKLTGIENVYAVIGGFHEEWNPEALVLEKVKYLESLNPEVICGMHCTGFTFNKLMSRHPAHTLGIVGTEFHL